MPPSYLLSQIKKFIPKEWKQTIHSSQLQTILSSNSYNPQEALLGFLNCNESMIDTFVTFLKECAKKGLFLEAIRAFALIQSSPSASYDHISISLTALLFSCSKFKSLALGKQVHTHVIVLGAEQNPRLVPKLVTFYSSFGLLADAHVIVKNARIFHPLPWNLLINSYIKNGFCREALFVYREMVDRGIRPDNFTYPSVLKACGEELDIELGREVHRCIDASSLDWCLFVHNALVAMYGKCGEVDVARKLFGEMPERDAVAWNSIISAYASKGMWTEAFEIFESMRADGADVNIITWNTILGGCLRTSKYKRALELLSQMRIGGMVLDSVATIAGLGACSHIGELKLGKEIHGVAIRSFFESLDNVQNSLITMYSRCNDLSSAYMMFCLVESKNVITWNSIISGYAHWDRSEEASLLFRDMLHSRVEPNYVTIASILPLCARVANLQHGKEFHCYMTKREGFKDYLLLWNALVDMYARSGNILAARRLFDLLIKKDEITYTSLIAGYGIQGKGQAAIELFEEMNKFQIKADHVTMVAILSACSHSGLVAQGEIIFGKMQSVYGITPRLEHFACMVDLYGRAGLLRKARDIILAMPYQPTTAMWATLLGACRIHRNTDLGEWAAERLLELKPENSGYYVLIANMYAAAGCWNKLQKVRTFMRNSGVLKATGYAWVDTGAGFTPFSVADTNNTQADDIYSLVGELTEQMNDDGLIVPKDDLDDEFLEEQIG